MRHPPEDPLDIDSTELRRMVEAAVDRIGPFIDSLEQQPTHRTEGSRELSRALIEKLPEHGTPFPDILDLLFGETPEDGGLIARALNPTSPGYLAYVPGGGLLHSAVAELISCAVNRYVGVWMSAPGLVQLETNVIRWFCQVVGYPTGALGFLTSGGSLANLAAVMTARTEKLGEDFSTGVLYYSDQTHHSVRKAAVLAGIAPGNLRIIETDSRQRISIDLLQRQIAEDRSRGLDPFLVVGNGGTTNTGAVDDLSRVGEICRSEEIWFHVDAAYGGFFCLTERGRHALLGIGDSDSVTLDPHKSLFLPYGTGSLLVRRGNALRQTFALAASYLPQMQHDPDFVDYCEISPELTRDYRGLRVWLPIKMLGIAAFRSSLDEKLDLSRWAAAQLESIEGVEVVAGPQLSVVAFRLRPEGLASPQLDQLNRRFLDNINERRRVYLTGTILRGQFVLRICVLSFRTHKGHMEQALEDIRTAARKLLEEHGQQPPR